MIYEKLLKIQTELKVPKNHYNSFGKYNYRNAEDILEGLKPLMEKYKVVLMIMDSIINVNDRIYVKATGLLVDVENREERIECYGIAREPITKKGMDDAQITGATSSYARKYMLNGLFGIDDSRDADSMQQPETKHPTPAPAEIEKTISEIRKIDSIQELEKYYAKHVKPRYTGDDLAKIVSVCADLKNRIGARNDNNK